MNDSPSSAAPGTPAAAGRPASTLRYWAIGLLITAITLGLCLGALELVGYLWERSTAQESLGWTLVASRRLDLERQGDPDRPYYLFRPNEDYLWEGIPVHINSRGLRTDEFATPKPAGTYRILNVGDSVAFGWEVSQEDTYGKQLEQLLNAQSDQTATGDQPTRFEVINAGVPGWTVESARNFLLQEGLDYEPDMVILDLTVVNDIYGQGPAVAEGQPLVSWLRDHTYFWPFLTTQARFLLARQVGPEAIPVLNPPRDAAAYYPLEDDSPVWDEIWSLIAEMAQASHERGIEFAVLAFPSAFQLNSAAHPDVPQRVLEQRATADSIDFLDLLPVYRQVCEDAGPEACEGYENLLFADVWMHPNPLGHRLAAEELGARWLQREP